MCHVIILLSIVLYLREPLGCSCIDMKFIDILPLGLPPWVLVQSTGDTSEIFVLVHEACGSEGRARQLGTQHCHGRHCATATVAGSATRLPSLRRNKHHVSRWRGLQNQPGPTTLLVCKM